MEVVIIVCAVVLSLMAMHFYYKLWDDENPEDTMFLTVILGIGAVAFILVALFNLSDGMLLVLAGLFFVGVIAQSVYEGKIRSHKSTTSNQK